MVKYGITSEFIVEVGNYRNREEMFRELGSQIDRLENMYGGIIHSISFQDEPYKNRLNEKSRRVTKITVVIESTGVL